MLLRMQYTSTYISFIGCRMLAVDSSTGACVSVPALISVKMLNALYVNTLPVSPLSLSDVRVSWGLFCASMHIAKTHEGRLESPSPSGRFPDFVELVISGGMH